MLSEFKKFIMRGNVLDLAVALIIGGTFGAIVNSLISDIITPIILKPALKAPVQRTDFFFFPFDKLPGQQ